MVLKYLIRKELIQLWRNGFLPRLVVLFPVMVMGVMPWIMTMEVRNVRVSVVDNDRSTLSSRLVHSIEASRYFVFHARRASYAEALTDIERSAADVVVSIPPHYGRDVERGAGLRYSLQPMRPTPPRGRWARPISHRWSRHRRVRLQRMPESG